MAHQKQLIEILIAAVIAILSVYGVKELWNAYNLCGEACTASWLSISLFLGSMAVVAALPVGLFLRVRKVENYALIGLFGMVMTFAISFASFPLAHLVSIHILYWLTCLIAAPCLVLMYWLFNRIRLALAAKIAIAIALGVVVPAFMLLAAIL